MFLPTLLLRTEYAPRYVPSQVHSWSNQWPWRSPLLDRTIFPESVSRARGDEQRIRQSQSNFPPPRIRALLLGTSLQPDHDQFQLLLKLVDMRATPIGSAAPRTFLKIVIVKASQR